MITLALLLAAGASSVLMFHAVDGPQGESATQRSGTDALFQRIEAMAERQKELAARLDEREVVLEKALRRVKSLENRLDELSLSAGKGTPANNRVATVGKNSDAQPPAAEDEGIDAFASFVGTLENAFRVRADPVPGEEEALKADFLAEERAPAFAEKMETTIQGGFRENLRANVSLSFVECRSRVCRVDYIVQEEETAGAGTTELDMLHALSSQFEDGSLEIYEEDAAGDGKSMYFRILE